MNVGYNWVTSKWEVYVVNYSWEGERTIVLEAFDEEEEAMEHKLVLERNL